MKKSLLAVGLCFLLSVSATPALAEKYIIDIDISGLEMFDLGAFDIDVNYDDSKLTFDRYFLTDALGSISLGNAEDFSFGDYFGSVNVSVLSYIEDFDNEPLPQPDAFTLATLIFDIESINPDQNALSLNGSNDYGIGLSNIFLSDENGESIPFMVTGTKISAVPIPATALLLGSGIIGLATVRRQRWC